MLARMRFPLFLFAVAAALAAPHASPAAAEPAQTVPVWPDGVAGPVQDKAPERTLPSQPNAKQVWRLEGVTAPSLMVYPAPKAKSTGTSVIIAPGGGYSKLALDLEGTEVAEYLNSLGITAFVLKYRTAPAGSPEPQLGPAMDVQRSVSLVRSKAAEFGVAPDRIGVLGISAGGQASVIATSNHAHRLYPTKGALDSTSCRPDFLVLVYPWRLPDTKDATRLRADIRVDATMPPTFIAHATDDAGAKVEGSLMLFQQLHTAKVPVELHAYAKGGHGFGLRPAEVPCPSDWPKRFAEWLAVVGFAKK
jgi:acetyl esterase/lipase